MNRFRVLAAILFTFSWPVVAAPGGEILDVGRFSPLPAGGGLPEGWTELTFPKIPKRTRYRLVEHAGKTVVEARAEASASGIIREMRIDPREYPIVRWSWKVSNVLAKGDVTRKEGDDYPARLYITFEYDPSKLGFLERAKFEAAKLYYGEYPPIAALNYIWETRAPVGTVVANPFVGRAMMIVVESGGEKVGEWIEERRDLLEDYRGAFGEDPPAIAGVAIMSDTDNTGESATAWYGDIVFEKAAPGP